eukprot:TRINITY_DN10313_c0_g1_i4.p1 TRINITY_DN10313_c0_g1~~TRINITY_DN10313_c0_g1_i4.p1  ORF type:complete len:285 (+),score=5.31 TRINITY_DN10313_c0_g1_i4:62-916(+)
MNITSTIYFNQIIFYQSYSKNQLVIESVSTLNLLQMSINLKLLINDKLYVYLNVDKEVLSSRSILFKGILESLHITNDQQVKLQLERPEKISILLDYIENGRIGEELKNFGTFASYINDIVYLGIHELEIHALDMIQRAIIGRKSDQIDFSLSRPTKDFIERFVQEHGKNLRGSHDYDFCKFVMNWVEDTNMSRSDITKILDGCIDFTRLSLQQIKELHIAYRVAFDQVMQPSFLAEFWMFADQRCSSCEKIVSKCSIGKDACLVEEYDYSIGKLLYQMRGKHR